MGLGTQGLQLPLVNLGQVRAGSPAGLRLGVLQRSMVAREADEAKAGGVLTTDV